MASKFLKKHTVPKDFPEVLSNLTKEILREQPEDITHFAACYFEHLNFKKSPFKYEKDHRIGLARANTSESHQTEKNVVNEYVSNLYNFSLDKFVEIEKSNLNSPLQGFLIISIFSANSLIYSSNSMSSLCIAFISNDPDTILQTNVENGDSPVWNFQDKLPVRFKEENDLLETYLVFKIFSEEEIIGETSVRLDLALNQEGEWELKLNGADGDEGYGNLNLIVNFERIEDDEEKEQGL